MMLGDIALRSSLGQPLRATIPVRAEAGEQLDDTCFSLIRPAQQDDFTYLTQARLALEEVNGRLQLKISSQQAISEPFIRLSIQADCGQGRFNRVFTVLLDPEELVPPSLPAAVKETPSPARQATPRKRVKPEAVPRKPRTISKLVVVKPVDSPLEKSQPVPAAVTGEGGFRLKLSSEELNLSMLGKLTEEQRQHLREKQRLLDADDQVANTLSMKNRIMQLQEEIAEMQVALAKTNQNLAMREQLAVAPANKTVQTSPGMFDNLFAGLESLSLRGLVGVSLILALLLSVWWRWRRQQAEVWLDDEMKQEFSPDAPYVTSIPPHGEKPPTPSAPATEVAIEVAKEDDFYHGPTSIFGAESGAVTFTEAESILDEADLYLAYGWSNRAIELLQGYLEKHPDDVQLWKKLFETYSAQEMKQEFEQLALRCQATMDDSGLWVLVQKLGRQLDAENPLYLSSPEQEVEASAETHEPEAEPPAALDAPLEFVLDGRLLEVKEEQPEAMKENKDMDLDPLFPDLFETTKKETQSGPGEEKGG